MLQTALLTLVLPAFSQIVVERPAAPVLAVQALPTFGGPVLSLPFQETPLSSLPSLKVLASGSPASGALVAAPAGSHAALRTATFAGRHPLSARPAASVAAQASPARHLAAVAAGLAANEPSPAPLGAAFDGTVPFRLKIREPGVYLLERDPRTGDDSNGRLISASHDETDVAAGLGQLWLAGGPHALRGQRLYVTGVTMGQEKAVREKLESLADAVGLATDQGDVRVLAIPRPGSQGRARALLDRLVYFWPSFVRDFQMPLVGEIVSDVFTTAFLEAPNALYLLAALPRPDAWLVLGTHTALIAAYTLFQRSTTNWLLRSGKKELYVKQVLMSLPFVLNYNILGHYTPLLALHHAVGSGAMAGMLPGALVTFLVTQGLTLALQTVFYSVVVIRGFRGWAASQKTPEDSGAARAWVAVLLVPWLWMDSIFLTQAGATTWTLLKLGPFSLTAGHVFLGLWTALGAWAASKTGVLDATLGFYKKLRSAFGRRTK